MNATKKNTNEISSTIGEEQEIKEKKCFAIMPIADHPDYDSGHFGRVYNHLIKPACEKAGYKVIRADDAKASHMIMFDILKNIIECDMAICDLSSKNANVFYELGLRQAFNKKTILITDGRTNTPFDITGFRYVKYDHTLRVDSVMNDIDEISSMLAETSKADDNDVNSIVKLLKIQPAQIDKVQLNEQDSLIFSMIKQLDEKMSRIERFQKPKSGLNAFYDANHKSLNEAILENIAERQKINKVVWDNGTKKIYVHLPQDTPPEKDEDKE
ncbi:hypothetical protein ACMWIM_002769 [Citrobacter amalonaticus]|uniref:hypothetical protein n=1 Tax=Citrobacter amalonaticus TaxID=35703 RepID=UPI003D6FB087